MSDSATPWTAACQASLSITNSRSLFKLMSITLVMPSYHLILCRPLLLLPQIPPGIRIFSNESTVRMRWPKYWSSSFSIISSKEIPGLISFMKVKEESQKVGLKLNIQKTKIMASSPISSWQIDCETVETVVDFIFLGS